MIIGDKWHYQKWTRNCHTTSYPAPDLVENNWEFTELWIDPMLSPPYILLLLCDSEGNRQIYDPKQGDKEKIKVEIN
ncbi:MAG: hypothetical protein ACLBM6_08310 [Cuspidothrix sp.]